MIMSSNIYLFYASILYLFLLQIITFPILLKRPIEINKRWSVWLIIIISLSIRLLPALIFPFASGYDVTSFLAAGERIIHREDIYQDLTFRYHYSFLPTYAMICALLIDFAKWTGISVVLLMKSVIVLFDATIVVLISIICKKSYPAFIYAFCPIPIILSAYFGQFDAIPLFFLLLGIFLTSKKRLSCGLLSLGIGTCFKPWVLLFMPIILLREKWWYRRRKLLIYYFIPLFIITLLYILIIPSGNIINMFKGISLYISVAGWWGPSIILGKIAELTGIPRILTFPSQISKIATVGMIIYLAIKLKNKDIFYTTKLAILTIYIFSLGFAIQYLVWILPFLIITKDKYLKYYLTFVGLYYLTFGTTRILDYHFQPPQIPELFYFIASFLLWLFFVRWGMKERRKIELH